MSLCNVHANLFKGAIQNVEVADTDHPGHPVQVFKQENLALRAALMRVRRLLSTYESTEDEDLLPEIRKGLQRQLGLVGQLISTISVRNSCFLSWRAMVMIRHPRSCGV